MFRHKFIVAFLTVLFLSSLGSFEPPQENESIYYFFDADFYLECGEKVVIRMGGFNYLMISPWRFLRLKDSKIFFLVPQPKTKSQEIR